MNLREKNDRMVVRLLDLEKAYPRVSKPTLCYRCCLKGMD